MVAPVQFDPCYVLPLSAQMAPRTARAPAICLLPILAMFACNNDCSTLSLSLSRSASLSPVCFLLCFRPPV